MASGLVVYIAAGDDRHTEVLSLERVRVGESEDCELKLPPGRIPETSSAGPILELVRANGHYHIASFDSAIDFKLNGSDVSVDQLIADGDELHIAGSSLRLQFFPVADLPALVERRRSGAVAPFIEHAALESAATVRRDDAKIFLREFTRELIREISLSTKLITLAIVLALAGGLLYFGFANYKENQKNRRILEDQHSQIAQVQDQVNRTNSELQNLGQSNRQIIESLSLAVKLRSDYGAGVCLISGSYVFVEPGTNRVLRYPEVQTNEEGMVIQSGTDPVQLTPAGNGPQAEFEFVGTGFYVGSGFVLTNRHVVQPWNADESAQVITGNIRAQPRLRNLVAYFPGIPNPIPLKFRVASRTDDVAVCNLDTKEEPSGIPVLPLEKDSETVAVGKPVVMMAYPSGPDRILAMLDDKERNSIQARYGSSLESLLSFLSEKNKIQPLTTQGAITDLDARRIVYDARTAEGGSGAPLFGPSARVIGINFAIFAENTASNMAVPVRYGLTLLQSVGWKPPEPPVTPSNE